jgi:hypothetical protein
MNHILKKKSIAGGGKRRSSPAPPIYKPPAMGDLQYGASYSYAETLDLISDGPIEGLVNQNGTVVSDGLKMLQGIYLDDTPVAVTDGAETTTSNSAISENQENQLESNPISINSSGATSCKNFFENLQKQLDGTNPDGRTTSLKYNNNQESIWNTEFLAAPSVNMLYYRQKTKDKGGESTTPKIKDRRIDVAARAYIEDFFFWLNTTRDPESAGTTPAYAGYRKERDKWSENKNPRPTAAMYWTDSNEGSTNWKNRTNSSRFFFGLQYVNVTHGHKALPWTRFRANDLVKDDLNTILRLYTENNAGRSNIDVAGTASSNKYQRDLASKALSKLGWNGGSVKDLLKNFLKRGVSVEKGDAEFFAIIKPNLAAGLSGNIVQGENSLIPYQSTLYGATTAWNISYNLKNNGAKIIDCTCPEITSDGTLTGNMLGFVLIAFPAGYQANDLRLKNQEVWGKERTYFIDSSIKDALKDLSELKYARQALSLSTSNDYQFDNLKFNFSNVLSEFRNGEEGQNPFSYFNRIFIDQQYGGPLYGPFSTANNKAPQKIKEDGDMLKRSSVLNGDDSTQFNLTLEKGLPLSEGSEDKRISSEKLRNYSEWANNSLKNWDEKAIPITHTVLNPNVESVFITLSISSLKDTLTKNVENVKGATDNKLDIGSVFPSVLNIRVETGIVGLDGENNVKKSYDFRIVALIEGQTLIDIGNPDYQGSSKDYVIALDQERSQILNQPFDLPSLPNQNIQTLTSDGERGIESSATDTLQKRFVRVTKLSHETNSVLLSKDVSLQKVTEIIPVNLPYPFSAVVGTKLDSRSFGSIPTRTYDCKLKKVKIPSNYFPTKVGGIDKRYYKTTADFSATIKKDKLVYKGDWDGTFHDELKWTDNPAWILYDLLTNSRYGMGQHVDETIINKWQLYKIGRFCDAVDEEGYFEGVTDGRGGREPRFSCNVVFEQGEKIFDSINTIASIFRGKVFFGNSEINFVDDRPRSTVNLFTNESVKDGIFYYSNNRRDEQFNTIEIAYKDRFDNFFPKIEVVEDEEDIRQRGVFKKRIEAVGITSRAMARRVGQHEIFSKIKENQQVAFTAGLESLLCQPGDLVTIEDELKTLKSNFGKVLAVDLTEETIRVSNTFDSSDMNSVLTIYQPTGRDDIQDVNNLALVNRERYYQFEVTSTSNSSFNRDYTGIYNFSGYTAGFPNASGVTAGESRFQEYALYSGLGGIPLRETSIYFTPEVTGWVFGSGNSVSITSGDWIAVDTGAQTIPNLNTGFIIPLDVDQDNKRAAAGGVDFSGSITNLTEPTFGVINNEISVVSPDQLTKLTVTGSTISSPAALEAQGFNPYGSVVSGFDRPELLPFIKLGSPVKFEIKNANPFIYKVLSLQEQAPNEYLVNASKYDTGKFDLIEKDISIETLANTFSYKVSQTINETTYSTLPAPVLAEVTTGVPNLTNQTFSITGRWNAVSNSTGYNSILTYPNGQTDSQITESTGTKFTGIDSVGVFNYQVNALGNKGGDGGNAYFDSSYDESGLFVVYEELLTFNKSFIDKITIL